MLLRSGARRAGAQQDYSVEMLAAEINGVTQGLRGSAGGREGGERGGGGLDDGFRGQRQITPKEVRRGRC